MKTQFQLATFFGFLSCLLIGVLESGVARAENALTVGSASANSGATAELDLKVSADSDAQGFVLVFEWDAAKAKGVDVVPNDGAGKPLNGADLVQTRVADGFMILAAVMDVDGKDGEKIAAGQNQVVGTAKIRCEGPAQGTTEIALKLVDNKHARVDGGPALSNLIAIAGRSIGKAEGLRLRDGVLTCKGDGEPPPPTGKIMFAAGGTLTDDGVPRRIRGARESKHKVYFYYKAPGSKDRIQGFSMAVQYSCDLDARENTFSLDGGELEGLKPEFVHLQVDNAPTKLDKDGCEFTLGVLIDAKSPFDSRTLPTTTKLKRLFTMEFEIENDADCGKDYWVKFMDGLNGNGSTDVHNRVSVAFFSQVPQLMNGTITVDGSSDKFVRGDCNLSSTNKVSVDIADAAAMVGYFFLTGENKFNAPCDDACDANDDGRLDASDVVYLLNYLFIPKSPKPPTPGPTNAGTDPTNDNLGCDGGKNDC